MKKIIVLFVFGFLTPFANCQVLSPSVVSTAGGFFQTASASISYTVGETSIESYISGNGSLTQGFQQGDRKLRVTGHITYNNALNSPMGNTKVYLRTLAGIFVDSAFTTSSGQFFFYGVAPGTYVFKAATSIPSGSINAVDALLTAKHFVQLIFLSGMKKQVADVNGSNSINSTDALLISKRFTQIITTFSVGDWLFTKDTITVNTFPYTHDLKALCFGDVNASYIPNMKTASENSLLNKGSINVPDLQHVEIPIIAEDANTLGSVSWVMSLPETGFKVNNIRMNTNKGQLVYNVVDHELRLCWYSTEPLELLKNDPLFFIDAAVSGHFLINSEYFKFSLSPESVFSDPAGIEINQLEFRYPSLDYTGNIPECFVASNYPNPANELTYFRIGLPSDANVAIRVFDLPGREIRTIHANNICKGLHEIQFDTKTLTQGTYIYHVEAVTQSSVYNATGKFEVSR